MHNRAGRDGVTEKSQLYQGSRTNAAGCDSELRTVLMASIVTRAGCAGGWGREMRTVLARASWSPFGVGIERRPKGLLWLEGPKPWAGGLNLTPGPLKSSKHSYLHKCAKLRTVNSSEDFLACSQVLCTRRLQQRTRPPSASFGAQTRVSHTRLRDPKHFLEPGFAQLVAKVAQDTARRVAALLTRGLCYSFSKLAHGLKLNLLSLLKTPAPLAWPLQRVPSPKSK